MLDGFFPPPLDRKSILGSNKGSARGMARSGSGRIRGIITPCQKPLSRYTPRFVSLREVHGDSSMAVKLRLKRMGRTNAAFYRLSAIDSRSPRDGRVIEELGYYNPREKEQAKQFVAK